MSVAAVSLQSLLAKEGVLQILYDYSKLLPVETRSVTSVT